MINAPGAAGISFTKFLKDTIFPADSSDSLLLSVILRWPRNAALEG
jgi:hypothetical protein